MPIALLHSGDGMTGEQKKILFIMQRPPYGSSAARESLDAALAAAAFEQEVQLLFTGDGVWQLLPDQAADAIHCKNIGKMLQALAYYDIKDVFADGASLAERQLAVEHLSIPVTALEGGPLRKLLQDADCVIAL